MKSIATGNSGVRRRLFLIGSLVVGSAFVALSPTSNGVVSADGGHGSFRSVSPEGSVDTQTDAKVQNRARSGSAYALQVTGNGGVPSDGVSAVALNVTVTETEAGDYGGFVTVYPCGTRPDASNLNFTPGQTIPNAVIAPVSADGKVCFYVYGKAHLLADVSGYFTSGFE